MKLFRKVIAITLLLISFVYSQVNTEAIRGNNLLPGIHHNLELDFAYISGNTEILNLNGSYRTDYVSNSNQSGAPTAWRGASAPCASARRGGQGRRPGEGARRGRL